MFLAVGNPGFALSWLLGQLARYFIDCGVEIVLGVLGVDVRARHREMHLDNMLFGSRLIVKQTTCAARMRSVSCSKWLILSATYP